MLMSLYELPSFLYNSRNSDKPMFEMYQCPYTGFLHFYAAIELNAVLNYNVSMPLYGLPSFLYCTKVEFDEWHGRYQCPYTGFLHFYKLNLTSDKATAKCINALIRASFISIGELKVKGFNKEMYQCPYTGFLHFYARPLNPAIYAASR